MGTDRFPCGAMTVLELDSADGRTTLGYTKATELHTLGWLKG